MDLIFSAPYTVRVLFSLLLILMTHRLLKQLWIAVFLGMVSLMIWTGHEISQLFYISMDTLFSANVLFLLLTICLVIWLSSQMSNTGMLKELVRNIQALTSPRASLAVLPAMIGFLPMPGGAIFSAPLLDDCDLQKQIPPVKKTQINYWFRHIWEYWWPLYPGVLLAIDISGLPILSFILLQIPLSLFSIAFGYLFILRSVQKQNKDRPSHPIKFLIFCKPIMPIFLIILCYSLIHLFIPVVAQWNKYLPMMTGILISILFVQITRPSTKAFWKTTLLSGKTWNLVLLVALIMVYGAFIESKLPDGSLLMDQIRLELHGWGVPLLFILILLPLISGFTTGIAVGMVGASFPIVFSLLGPSPSVKELLQTTVIAYSAGYIGMILSPVHICLIVTNEYFKTSLSGSLRRLILPCMGVMMGAFIIYKVIEFLF